MLTRVARIITKAPWLVAILMLIFMAGAGAIGSGVTSRLTSGGFDDPASDSSLAGDRISRDFKQEGNNVLLLITAKTGTVDDEVITKEALQTEQKMAAYPNMTKVASYWSTGKPTALRGTDGKQAIIIGTLKGNDVEKQLKDFTPAFTTQTDTTTVRVGGSAEINRQFTVQIEDDLKVAEMIALPITLLILILVFRSVVAALLPILIGVFSILGTFLVLYGITTFADVSIYALNLTTMLGLGLAIDYSLFIVSRFREHLAKGESVDEAVRHSVEKAGRTVLFSALTVAASLAALLVFPQAFLRSFAYAGVAVSLVAALGAIVLLPAIMKLLGSRINSLRVGKAVDPSAGSPFWRKVAEQVMRRPIVITTVVVLFLLVLGIPFLSINPGQSDDRALPVANPARMVHDDLRNNFSSKETAAIQVVSKSQEGVTTDSITSYAIELSKVAKVDHVEAATGIYKNGALAVSTPLPDHVAADQGAWFSVVSNVEPVSSEGADLVKTIRKVPAPFSVYVGGTSAHLADLKDSINKLLPRALGIVAIATFVLLFMMFGSLLVPLKAIIINILSLSAVFGLMVWIFQDGHLSGLLKFTATGMLDASMPILMFCVAFGLSMDYEVFLLSRIKEDYDKNHNNSEAVAHGLEKTGGLVTAAALSISVVFFAFATTGVAIIKLFGLGLAVAVLLDAFVIRGTLVPAFMKLAGDANWWAPGPLAKLYKRFGISE